ncbi:MAG: hypothetical protein PHH36_02345 [Sideroxydans sp.]|nr:hypothetical protein [Sideroxydans sp.]
METFIAWVIGLLALFVGIVMLIGFIALVFDDPGEEHKPVKRSRSGLGKALVAGILLVMWWRNDD